MAGDTRSDTLGDDDFVGPLRPKRAPPTLDLSATEIPRDPPPAADGADSPPSDQPAVAQRRPRSATGIIPAALSGATAAALMLAAAWIAGWPFTPPPQPVLPAQPDRAALDALTARVARAEAQIAKPTPAPTADPAQTQRIDALDKATASLRSDIDALKSQPAPAPAAADSAPPPDLSPLTARIAQLETATRAQSAALAQTTALAQQNAKPPDDTALRRAMAVLALDGLVRQGAPYADALAAAMSLGIDPGPIASLQPTAATGLAPPAALCAELLSLLPQAAPTSAVPAGKGFIARIKAGAARLVKIERIDGGDSTSDDAALGNVRDAARRNDLAATRRAVAALTPAERVPLQGWLTKVDAREAALAASRMSAADALAALAKPVRQDRP